LQPATTTADDEPPDEPAVRVRPKAAAHGSRRPLSALRGRGDRGQRCLSALHVQTVAELARINFACVRDATGIAFAHTLSAG
jgi:hypothetical protein